MKLSDVEKLIKLVEESNVAEVEVQFNRRQKIRVSKVAGQPATPVTYLSGVPASSTPAAAEETKETKPSRPSNIVAIKSPMVGTFYRASAPDAPPYVEVGDTVKPGTVVCIVEAMKLMNEIESEVSGRVAEILVENETPVEYGQELFLIEPS
ncbi:acetyl-CoA carboxylase biotin carboxyl carrier protein [candidate division WOR-3 bacterium]|nr:acetyl-CoA carboxylase biotin carboxyl carrier protein [candidate division WOR-3 bacterium]